MTTQTNHTASERGRSVQTGLPMGKKVVKDRCVVLGAAPIRDYDRIAALLTRRDYLICADGGLVHAQRLGLEPDLVVGDFDSYSGERSYRCETVQVPSEKDESDTLLAVRLAADRGYRRVLLLGGTGGRMDHTVSNLQTLVYGLELGLEVSLADEDNLAFVLRNECRQVEARPGWMLSVFCYGDRAEGVNLSGVKYPVKDGTLTNAFPLGLSNEFRSESASIGVERGTLLVILSRA